MEQKPNQTSGTRGYFFKCQETMKVLLENCVYIFSTAFIDSILFFL